MGPSVAGNWCLNFEIEGFLVGESDWVLGLSSDDIMLSGANICTPKLSILGSLFVYSKNLDFEITVRNYSKKIKI